MLLHQVQLEGIDRANDLSAKALYSGLEHIFFVKYLGDDSP